MDALIHIRDVMISGNSEPLNVIKDACTVKICEIITTIAKFRNMDSLLI